MRWLDGITGSTNMDLGEFQEILKDREAWHVAVHEGVTKSQTRRLNSNNNGFFFFQQWFLRRLMTKRKCFIRCLAYRKHSINNTNNNKPRHLSFLKHFKLFIHKLQITVFAKILFYKVAAQSAACKTHCSFSFHMVTFHPLGIVNWIKPINLIPSCFTFHCEVSIKGLLINTVSAHVRSGEDIS